MLNVYIACFLYNNILLGKDMNESKQFLQDGNINLMTGIDELETQVSNEFLSRDTIEETNYN